MRPAKPISDRPSIEFAGSISKRDEDKQLVFGWASVVSKHDEELVTDLQGDVITPDELEEAAYDYVLKSRDGGVQHAVTGVSTLVESMVFTQEKWEALGVPSDVSKIMPTGWWVGFKVHDESVWKGVKEGRWTEFSVHGTGLRTPL